MCFPDGSVAKNPPAMQETRVQSLGQEDPWRRKWQPTPVFLPGESCGQRNLVGYNPWDHKELDMTEQLSMQAQVLPLAEWIAQFDFKFSDVALNSST